VRNKSSFSCIGAPWRRRGAYKGPPKCDRCSRNMSLPSDPERLWSLLRPGPKLLWLCSGAEWKHTSFTAPPGVRSGAAPAAAPAWPETALGGTPGQSWKHGSFTAPPGVQPGAAPAPAPAAAERHRDKEFEHLDSTRGGKYIGKRLSSTSSSRAPLNSVAYLKLKYKPRKGVSRSLFFFLNWGVSFLSPLSTQGTKSENETWRLY
jgi:hypothetical protein